VQNSIVTQLARLLEEGEAASSERAIDLWSTKVTSFLKAALGTIEASEFHRLKGHDEWAERALRLGHIQGLIARTEAETHAVATTSETASIGADAPNQVSVSDSNRVFIVHGHDNAAKEGTARFLEKLGLQPIILHEQPSGGRTIIEKFEMFSRSASFAVVLLTPDDVGAVSSNSANLQPRARQNVVLELGYFMGRLGRDRVCALYSGGIELPSDYQGVIYVEMDTSGAWKAKLAQEFVQARLPINLEGLISG